MNIVMLIGYVCSAVDIKKVGSTDCATFRISIEESFKGKDGTPKTIRQNITIKSWSHLAQVVSNLKEGDLVSVQGAFKTDSYDKQGTRQYMSFVNAEKIVCLEKKNNSVFKKIEKEEECPF